MGHLSCHPWPGHWDRVHPRQVCRGIKTGRISISIRGTLPCWRIGLGIISWCAKGGNRKICLLREMHPHAPGHSRGCSAAKYLCRKRPEGQWSPSWRWSTASGAAICWLLSADWVRWSFPSSQHWWGTSGVLGAVLGSPVKKRYKHTEVSLVQGLEGAKGTGASFMWGETERANTDQPGEIGSGRS